MGINLQHYDGSLLSVGDGGIVDFKHILKSQLYRLFTYKFL